MKKQKGFTLIELIIVFVVLIGLGSWIWNAVKLASCDFESNYRCEVLHGAGLVVPPLSILTAWFDDDGE
jgi:prepilin-type N-terminal cleavage/methylation domain-containing protein